MPLIHDRVGVGSTKIYTNTTSISLCFSLTFAALEEQYCCVFNSVLCHGFFLLIFSICVTDLFDSVYRHFKDCECLLFLELMVNVLCNVTSYCCSTRDRYHGTREEVLDLKVCDKNWQIWFGNIHSSSVTTNSTVFMSR